MLVCSTQNLPAYNIVLHPTQLICSGGQKPGMGGKTQSETEGRRHSVCTIPPNMHSQGRWGKNHLNRKSPSCLGLARLGFHVMELSHGGVDPFRDILYSRDNPEDEPLICFVIMMTHLCPPGYVAHLPTGVTRCEASTTFRRRVGVTRCSSSKHCGFVGTCSRPGQHSRRT
jgi:hypothetical protein